MVCCLELMPAQQTHSVLSAHKYFTHALFSSFTHFQRHPLPIPRTHAECSPKPVAQVCTAHANEHLSSCREILPSISPLSLSLGAQKCKIHLLPPPGRMQMLHLSFLNPQRRTYLENASPSAQYSHSVQGIRIFRPES